MPDDDRASRLAAFKDRVEMFAGVIGAPADLLPTYGRTDDSARPHVEFDGRLFHFVVVERGEELDRQSSPNPDDILYRVFESVTFSMAVHHEARHRRPNEDPRRQLFDEQLRLLDALSPTWHNRAQTRLNHVLEHHPFQD